jgi:hypothetical protein
MPGTSQRNWERRAERLERKFFTVENPASAGKNLPISLWDNNRDEEGGQRN